MNKFQEALIELTNHQVYHHDLLNDHQKLVKESEQRLYQLQQNLEVACPHYNTEHESDYDPYSEEYESYHRCIICRKIV